MIAILGQNLITGIPLFILLQLLELPKELGQNVMVQNNVSGSQEFRRGDLLGTPEEDLKPGRWKHLEACSFRAGVGGWL